MDSESASESLPLHRRFAIGYLFATGLAYLWAGLGGLSGDNSILTSFFFRNSLVFPIATISHAIRTCASMNPCRLSELGYVWPKSTHSLAEAVIIVAVIAVGAAVAMFWNIKFGYFIWLGLVITCVIATVWNILGDFLIARGGGARFDLGDKYYIIPTIWSLTYAGAYWLARFSDEETKELTEPGPNPQ